MPRLRIAGFDLRETLNSGQVFHWLEPEPESGEFAGCIGETAVQLSQRGDWLTFQPQHARLEIERYLRLDDGSHERALAAFPPDDEPLQEAVAFCPGLRILRQPAWECLGTFITSSLKQVAHIRQISPRTPPPFWPR